MPEYALTCTPGHRYDNTFSRLDVNRLSEMLHKISIGK